MSAPTQAEIERILSGINQADAAMDYVDHQLCEMQEISGDDYKMVWSTKTRGDFPPAQ